MTDTERIAAIRARCARWHDWKTVEVSRTIVTYDIPWLLDRLEQAERERDALHQAGGYLYSALSLIQGGGVVVKDDVQRARAAWQRAIDTLTPATTRDAAEEAVTPDGDTAPAPL